MRPGIGRIELDRGLRELKRRFCLVEIAKETRMYKMLNVIHLHEAAVARRESGIFTDGIAKDDDRPLPAFGIILRHEILCAEPTIVRVERNIGP
jgi:hypothetical protein